MALYVNTSVRIFLGYFLILGVAGWLFLQTFTSELKPGMRQSLEEVLVDVANLLAEMVHQEILQGNIDTGRLAEGMREYSERNFNARIWFWQKQHSGMSVYITDARGIVIYDSRGENLGQDFSRWNDVYLTLRGQYGARTTRGDPEDELTSVMYVAAPVIANNEIIAVLTVSKPSISVQPFIDGAVNNLQRRGLWLITLSLGIGLLLSLWLTHSIRKLTRYADAVSQGKRASMPRLGEKELAKLATSMDSMRTELEGKHYVENYLHSLTHELKSPLAAIQGASELLQESLPQESRQRFIDNIHRQSLRMQQIVDRMLDLASIEKRQQLQQVETVALDRLIDELLESKHPLLQGRQLTVETQYSDHSSLEGETFLLRQAISNLLDNAIEFSPSPGRIIITIETTMDQLVLCIKDQGPGIPDYAQPRIFERFYSLARPDGSDKSTGLGLSFVREVITLHDGTIDIQNNDGPGVSAELHLPRERAKSGVVS